MRPAVLPEIAARCAALIGAFGASDDAVLDVVFGHARPEGDLPFRLPRGMPEMLNGQPDVPDKGVAPLFPFGHGLRYPEGLG